MYAALVAAYKKKYPKESSEHLAFSAIKRTDDASEGQTTIEKTENEEPPASSAQRDMLNQRMEKIIAFKKESDVLLCNLTSCAKLGSICCGRCKKAFYCCEDHRLKHWNCSPDVYGSIAHSTICIPVQKYDPGDVPIPGTTGPDRCPPGDHWNPEMKSICLDLNKVSASTWVIPNKGENKLIIVKFQAPLILPKDSSKPTITIYDFSKVSALFVMILAIIIFCMLVFCMSYTFYIRVIY